MDGARGLLFEVISGRRRGFAADLARAALATVEVCFRGGVAARNTYFDRCRYGTASVPVPVISIGNLTTGGTGKTPLVAWVVAQLQALGGRPAILSRGYRALDGQGNDEKRLLDRLCPAVPHVQNPNRAAAARRLLADSTVDALVLDDGLQHRRLHRDVNIVLIDVLNPWGFGRVLPRGLLREPPTALRRADVVVLTRSDLCTRRELLRVHRAVRRQTEAVLCHAAFRPSRLVNVQGQTAPLSLLAGQTMAAFCGVGNPDGFRRTIAPLFDAPAASNLLSFPDHHHYCGADHERIHAHAEARKADLLLTTEKDLVKFSRTELNGRPLWGLRIDVEFTHNGEGVRRALAHLSSCFRSGRGVLPARTRAA